MFPSNGSPLTWAAPGTRCGGRGESKVRINTHRWLGVVCVVSYRFDYTYALTAEDSLTYTDETQFGLAFSLVPLRGIFLSLSLAVLL